ncbi:MAG: hypothetical protein M3O50_02435 [Myxococcota bacterium]|nr:hypothetical protein [Myxococcota bacterium]
MVPRIVVLAVLAVVAAAWGLVNHVVQGRAPPAMLVAPPRSAAAYDADAGEIPVPEMYWDGG